MHLGATMQVLESHSIDIVAWHTCILPPAKEHCLVLRVPGTADGCCCGAPRELLLRAKSAYRVEELQRQLCMASLEAARQPLTEGQRLAQQSALSGLLGKAMPQKSMPGSSSTACAQQEKLQTCGPDPRSLSFGSPVAGVGSEAGGDSLHQLPPGTAAEGSNSAAQSCSSSGSDSECSSSRAEGKRPQSAPGSPVLPGLPLVALGRQVSASAPVSPAHPLRLRKGGDQVGSPEQLNLQQPETVPPEDTPVRLLSFGGRHLGGAARKTQQETQQQRQQELQLSNIQRLEQAVADLSSELAQARTRSSRERSPVRPAAVSFMLPAVRQACAAAEAGQADASQAGAAAGAGEGSTLAQLGCNEPAASTEGRSGRPGVDTNGTSSRQLGLLLQENSLLLQQQAALQAQLGRMQGQLLAAAADNVHLAQEAAGAVRQLQEASAALAASQQREAQLRESLAGAVGQCEAVGRELTGLSSKLEARTAQRQELR